MKKQITLKDVNIDVLIQNYYNIGDYDNFLFLLNNYKKVNEYYKKKYKEFSKNKLDENTYFEFKEIEKTLNEYKKIILNFFNDFYIIFSLNINSENLKSYEKEIKLFFELVDFYAKNERKKIELDKGYILNLKKYVKTYNYNIKIKNKKSINENEAFVYVNNHLYLNNLTRYFTSIEVKYYVKYNIEVDYNDFFIKTNKGLLKYKKIENKDFLDFIKNM